MTLHEAINAAFGQSEFVRRASWPEGSAAIVDPMSTKSVRSLPQDDGAHGTRESHPQHGRPLCERLGSFRR